MSWILRWRVNPFESDNLYVPIIYSFRARFNIARSGAYPYYDLYHFFTYDLSNLDWFKDDLGTDKMWGSRSSSEQFQLRKFHSSCCIFHLKATSFNLMVVKSLWWWLLQCEKRSPTSQTCNEHILSPKFVTSIDVVLILTLGPTRRASEQITLEKITNRLVNIKTKNEIQRLSKGPWRDSSENIKLPTHILFKLILTRVNVIHIIEKF